MTARPFPFLICDASLEGDPRGTRAFSYDGLNLHLPHPLPVGALVWTRDLSESPGTEMLATVVGAEKDGWPTPFWVYYLAHVSPPVRIADLAAAAGCRLRDFVDDN